MNTVQSQQFIVGALAATGVIAAGESIAAGHAPAARTVIGFAGASIGLGVIALWSPDFASSLAGLVLVAAIFTSAPDLWSGIISATSTPRPTPTKKGTVSV